jgi:NAD(P)-dependent dehydrogenase (short-subunit alcohol dehydrogenase family)
MPIPMLTPYAAVKHAVVGLTETLDIELRRAAPGVGATVLCPGPVKTALHRSSRELRPAEGPARTSAGPGSLDSDYGAPIAPAAVAALALEAIERDRVLVLTHRDGSGPIRARLERVAAALPAEPDEAAANGQSEIG